MSGLAGIQGAGIFKEVVLMYSCELVNTETGEVHKNEDMSKYGMKNRNNKLVFQGSSWRWRVVGNEDE